MRRRLIVNWACIGLLVLLHTGCGSSPTQPGTGSTTTQPLYTVSSFVTGLQATDGSVGVVRTGSAPAPSGGPSASPTGNSSVINGGSNLVRVRSSSSFQVIYVYVGNVSGGVSGYWEIRLVSPTTDVSIVVTFARGIPTGSFDCVIGVATASGGAGAYSGLSNSVVTQASTGEVQVSASWDALSDVDLHVVEPTGTEIYYGNRSSTAGGALDLDSNPACTIDRVNNENIRWTTGRAPSGQYTVRLDYYAACGVSSTNYVVTVNNGGTTTLYRGSFTGSGDFGGRGSGRLITQFSKSASEAIFGTAGIRLFELGDLLVSPAAGAVQSKRWPG